MSILVARLLENSDGQQENDYDNYEKHRHNNQGETRYSFMCVTSTSNVRG